MWDIAWITPKKKRNIWETATQITDTSLAPVVEWIKPKEGLQSFWDATKWQDVQFRQSYREALKTPQSVTDTPSETGLSWAELQAYNMLTPQEQAQYKALATQGLKAQTDYLTKSKANMEFQKSQETKRLEMEDNDDAIVEMQSQKQIEDAQKQVANLKQNIGYLWTGGQPWVSSQKLDAVSNQVTLADRTLKNIIEADRLSKRNRAIGQESNAEVFSRQMKILQDDLDGKVNKTVQSALNEFSSAELAGKLDTIPEIEAFQQQLYAQLDGDLSSIMDTNIEARKFLIERYDKLAESQKEQMQAKEKERLENLKRQNSINKEMSIAKGFYVNENGEMIRDEVTWKAIPAFPESKYFQNEQTWEVSVMTPQRDGSYSVSIHKVWSGSMKAPEVKEITMSDGSKVSMQWTGSQWSPIQSQTTQQSWDYYSQFRITQNVWAKSPNAKDNGYNGGTPWIDFAMPENTDVKATVWGVVSFVWPKWDYGNQVEITDSQGNKHMYSHLNGANVQVGQQVGAGSSIGLSGNTGFSTGAHLDYRVKWASGKWEDPNTYLGQWQESSRLADDKSVKVANVTKIAFGRNSSNEELKLVQWIMNKFPNASVRDIAMAVRGLDIPEEKADTAMSFIRVMDKLKDPPEWFEATIGNYISRDDMKWLNNYIQKHVENDAKATTPADQFISTPEQNKVTKNIDDIIKLIENNKNKIGAVDGRYTQLAKKFKSEPDIQKLQTLMTATFADLRKNFAWSAVTATELTALEDFIAWSTKEVPENLITKLQTLKDIQTGLYNDQRSMYGIQDTSKLQSKTKFSWSSLTDILSKLQ